MIFPIPSAAKKIIIYTELRRKKVWTNEIVNFFNGKDGQEPPKVVIASKLAASGRSRYDFWYSPMNT